MSRIVVILMALTLGALGALGGWLVQGWRLGEQLQTRERELAEEQVDAIRHVLKAERSHYAQASQAVAKARGREALLRRDADAARDERDRLRDASADAERAARDSHGACIERVAAFRDVFDHCAARYGELAEKAGRHVSDIRTLIDSWPRDVPRVADSAPNPPE